MKKNPIKVIFFKFNPLEFGGGFEKSYIDMANELNKFNNKLEIKIVTFTPEMNKKMLKLLSIYLFQKLEYTEKESKEDVLKKLNNVQYLQINSFKELKTFLRDFDLIYSKNEILESFVLRFFVGYKNLPPVIYHYETPIQYLYSPSFHAKLHNFLYLSFLYKFLISGAKGHRVVNDNDNKILHNRFNLANVQKIYRGYYFEKIEPPIKKSQSPLKILFIGRFTEQKGVDILIQVIRKLSKQNNFSDFHFKIAGIGDEKLTQSVEDIVKSFKNVEYLGFVPNKNTPDLYEWCDCVILPSRYESAVNITFEAAQQGRILLATKIPGTDEFIDHEETGYLVDLNVGEFVDKLNTIKALSETNPEILSKMGNNSLQKLTKLLNPDIINEQLYEFFKKISSK
jgi:glycosyltransferase involved in cell wall biosynthesis